MILIQGDDIRAFELFHDRHHTIAFSLALRILNDRVLAADASQEAFLAFWRSRARYRPAQSPPRHWLLGIVRHSAIDMLRRERKRRGDLDAPAPLARQLAPDCTEDQVIARDEHRGVRALLQGLPSTQRRVIELAYFGGLNHREIAQQLGLPLGTTKSRMRLAFEKLRVALDEEPLSSAASLGRVRRPGPGRR